MNPKQAKARAAELADRYIAKDGSEPDLDRLDAIGSLSPADYGRRRADLAEEMGTSLKFLDEEYKERRKSKKDGGAEHHDFLADPEPWPDPVDGSQLLDEISATASAHLVLPNGAAETVALWVLFTHAHDCFFISPLLAITSPTAECGKTTLLTILGALVPRPLQSSNVTAAVIFRAVDKWSPTLLIDEADTFLRDSDELRGVLNSGHNRSNAFTIRTVGDNFEPKQFSTWAPKAVAMIGKMHPTLSSRSIRVELQRKSATEIVESLRADRLAHLAPLQRKAARWVADNLGMLRSLDPELPSALYSRAADNWRPLIAVADCAGGEWPGRGRRVAQAFAARASDDTYSVVVLGDLRDIFERRDVDRLHSDDIVAELGAMEDRPWSEWRNGKPITKTQLAKMLGGFNVTPKQIWSGGGNKRGYDLETLSPLFTRYLSARPLDPLADKALRAERNARPEKPLEFEKTRNPLQGNGSSTLAPENPPTGTFGEHGDPFASLKDASLRLQPGEKT